MDALLSLDWTNMDYSGNGAEETKTLTGTELCEKYALQVLSELYVRNE